MLERLAACTTVLAMLAGGIGCDSAPAPPAAAPRAEPLARAPSPDQLLSACPLPNWYFRDLRAMLDAGDYAQVEGVAAEMLTAYRRTPACEAPLWNTVDYFATLEPSLLDRWVDASPEAWVAFAARGSRWVDTAYQRRGTKFANDVSQAQWAGMNEALQLAAADLARAIEIEPDAYVAYGYAINISKAMGDTASVTKQLNALLERQPANYGVRRRAAEALLPHWGGSVEAIREVADAADAFADANPMLPILHGFAEVAVVGQLARSQQHREAAEAFRRALAWGPYPDWFDGRARQLSTIEAWDELAANSDQWIAELGDAAAARRWRAQARRAGGDVAGALEDLDRAIELRPEDTYALSLRSNARRDAGDLEGAAQDLRRVLELAPADTWAMNHLLQLLARDPTQSAAALALARRYAEIAPGDPNAWFQLGAALSANGLPEARETLERYLELASGDGSQAPNLAQARLLLNPASASERTLPGLSSLR